MSDLTFSQKLKRLEEIVRKLESPDVELEEGLKLLEEGIKLHASCQEMLTSTQAKIAKLLDADGASPSPIEVAAEQVHEPIQPKRVHVDDSAETTDLFAMADIEVSTEKSGSDDGLPF